MLGPTKFWVLENFLARVETLASSCLDYLKPTYQILASYHPWNPRKSFRWWWVVGGGGGGWLDSEFSVHLWSEALAYVWTKLNKKRI